MQSASEPVAGAGGETDSLAPDAGSQTLLATDSMGSRLDLLPDEAFENLLVVSAGMQPAEVESRIDARDRDPRTVGVVPVSGFDVGYDGPLWTTDRVPPTDLTGISIRVSEGCRHLQAGRGWLVFDSISTLLMYAEAGRVYRLLDWLVRQARSNDITGVYTIQAGMVGEETMARYRTLCDAVREVS